MKDVYGTLNRIIEEELCAGKDIVIYPLGKIGLVAKLILKERYGIDATYIDNNLCNYNSEVISVEEYIKNEKANDTIIICLENSENSCLLYNDLLLHNVKAKIRNYLDYNALYSRHKENFFKRILEICKVKNAKGIELRRYGAKNDGGYVMANIFEHISNVYSFGIGDNIEWELEIKKYAKKILCFDPTIAFLPKDDSKLWHIKKALSDITNEKNSFISLGDAIDENGDTDSDDLILKMDVEGAEWDSLVATPVEVLKKFRQMTFEFHYVTDLEKQDKILSVFEKLTLFHTPIWIHANNIGGVEIANNFRVPSFLEMTLLRNDSCDFEAVDYKCPSTFDAPNVGDYFDIELNGWGSM